MSDINKTTDLTNELIYRKYLMNNGQHHQKFKYLSMAEYIALHIITDTAHSETIYSGRTYLKDLSDKMQLPIRQTSKIVTELRDRGLLKWAHDGDGTDGTYVTITDSGSELISKQEDFLKEYYGRVIEKYGKDNMIHLLRLMKELETVMSSEPEETEEQADAGNKLL